MSATDTQFQPASMADRASAQAIGYLMQQGIENADCLSLAAGFVDPETLPVELVRQTTAELMSASAGKSTLQYGTTPGSDSLREVFRNYLAELEGDSNHRTSLSLDRIVLTTGSQQLLLLVSQALFNPGDICLVAAPTYFVYLGVLDGVGANAIPVTTDENGMCPDALDAELQRLSDEGQLHRVKLVYVVSYHDNPAGISVSAERRPRLLDVVRKWSDSQHVFLLEDAAYRELHYDGPVLPSIFSYDQQHDDDRQHVILSQTFSKSFSPGLRVGVSVLPQQLIKPVFDLKCNEDFGSGHFSQNVVASVLQSGAYRQHVSRLQQSYKGKRDAMLAAADQFFSDVPGVSWLHPNGGLYVWMTLPDHVPTGFDSDLFKRATHTDKVMYVPGELCYPSDWNQRPRNQMRLSYGVLDNDGIREGIQRLASAVRAVV
ncbi:MAG: PLP-dependent aminotransferase family protein [Fuerstiella sp.]|nr:PLP-dependent aminotransferase family protein [Fuerstiella sp.]MDG2127125.1 PLP-dependent aminotransferase family protein [Fuerstiella sp.]